MPRKLPLQAPAFDLRKLVSDAVAEAEGVIDILPVGAGKLERHAVDIDPLAVGIVLVVVDAERPEVAVLDAADVVALIDIKTAEDRIAIHIADQVPRGPLHADALVGIQQQAIEHGRVLGVAGVDARRIRDRRHIRLFPFRVCNNDSGDGGVIAAQTNEGLVLGVAPSGKGLQDRALQVAGRRRAEGPLQRHAAGNNQIAVDAKFARRNIHDSAAGLARLIEGLLKRRGAVGLAVADGAGIRNLPLLRNGRSGKQTRRDCAGHPSFGNHLNPPKCVV